MTSRRRYLAGLGLAVTGTLAGCAAGPLSGSGDGPDGDGSGDGDGGGTGGNVSSIGAVSIPVPRSAMERGAAKDAIPAIVDPVFGEDWSGYSSGQYGEARLEDEDEVIGVERDGEARAYPLKILNWHEVVNDEFGGPLLVTFCPLCGSSITAVREVNGSPTIFGVSGLLYRNDLVMYDEATESLWSQIVAAAVNGPAAGQRLELVPSTLTTWGEWRDAHPDTAVLRPPPESDTVRESGDVRNYAKNPYAGYEVSSAIGVGFSSNRGYSDDRLHPKTTVVGVARDGEAVAYPLPAVQRAGIVNDTVGGLPVVVAATEAGTLVAYERTVGGGTLTFERADENHLVAGGSRWRITTGRAVDGPHEGTTLAQANDVSPLFFFAWKDFQGETAVYGASDGRTGTGTTAGTGTATGTATDTDGSE